MIKIGIIREGKVPPDARVPLTPEQCAEAQVEFPVKFMVEPSPVRCFKDEEYHKHGVLTNHDLSQCDVILGVKEVPLDKLMADKTYMFFSHTIKKQPYNRELLRAVLAKNIRLIDYEVLTDEQGNRLIAFGFYAGVVGAHNGLWTYGNRTGLFHLPRLCESHDYAAVQDIYAQTKLPPVRIVLSGTGRVAQGALKNLRDMGIVQVSPQDYLNSVFDHAVFTQIEAKDYVKHRDGKAFDKADFYANGQDYISTFDRFSACTDLFINGIFYDKKAPKFFELKEMQSPDFQIKVIADITCDIMPGSSVPCTIRASKIADPVYGFDPVSNKEVAAFSAHAVDVMAIDNLPSELPRDASAFFGRQLLGAIFSELLRGRESAVIRRGMIAENGQLTERYSYLSDYVGGS